MFVEATDKNNLCFERVLSRWDLSRREQSLRFDLEFLFFFFLAFGIDLHAW